MKKRGRKTWGFRVVRASRFKPEKYSHYLTLNELAAEVRRDPSWIRRLEDQRRIVSPVRVKRGKITIRLYSPQEVEDIRKVLEAIRNQKPPKKKKAPKPYGV